ncbi:hypothetical protein WICPIJ_003243 [Wickerhamomyces pijperi]|uniref:Uncharacterized protein n=1 Tax=Wickerhamomyces pijperi TaxID=599730 RepID=A0A9P8QA65_WICPI|nr:hypothetical protein WICPIJ_003243 [Wickerhamomyces pijperi]
MSSFIKYGFGNNKIRLAHEEAKGQNGVVSQKLDVGAAAVVASNVEVVGNTSVAAEAAAGVALTAVDVAIADVVPDEELAGLVA